MGHVFAGTFIGSVLLTLVIPDAAALTAFVVAAGWLASAYIEFPE